MINNRPHLRDEASIKIPKVWGSESSQIDEHMEVLGGGGEWKLHTLPQPDLMHLFHEIFSCILYDRLCYIIDQ